VINTPLGNSNATKRHIVIAQLDWPLKKSAKIGYSSALYCLEAFWLLSARAGTQHRRTETKWLDMNQKMQSTILRQDSDFQKRKHQYKRTVHCTALWQHNRADHTVVWENTGKDNPFLNALNILSQHTFYQCSFHCNAVHYPAERKQMVSD